MVYQALIQPYSVTERTGSLDPSLRSVTYVGGPFSTPTLQSVTLPVRTKALSLSRLFPQTEGD